MPVLDAAASIRFSADDCVENVIQILELCDAWLASTTLLISSVDETLDELVLTLSSIFVDAHLQTSNRAVTMATRILGTFLFHFCFSKLLVIGQISGLFNQSGSERVCKR